MFEKYIIIENEKIYVSQTSNGIWKCDKLPCSNTDEVRQKIILMNNILNDVNGVKNKKTSGKKKDENKTDVHGLK